MKTTKWSELKARMSPERRRALEERTARTLRRLAEIRKARGFTQATLADAMGAPQSQIAQLEHQTDVYLSTLRRFVEAMGGELDLVARFPDGEEVGVSLAEPRTEEPEPATAH
jgi:transcriptional regulator with XRE-family HTH domain